jgi:hypothetical protein
VSFLLGLACLITAIFSTQKGTCLRVPTAESARAIGGSGFSDPELEALFGRAVETAIRRVLAERERGG